MQDRSADLKLAFQFNKRFAHKVLAENGAVDRIMRNCSGLVVNTCFTGMKCAEGALHLAWLGLIAAGVPLDSTPTFAASCDSNADCRQVIRTHVLTNDREHVFGEMKDRIRPEALEILKRFQKDILMSWEIQHAELVDETVTKNLRSSCQNFADKQRVALRTKVEKQIKRQFGRELLSKYLGVLLDKGSWNESAKCYSHGRFCPLPHVEANCHSELSSLRMNASGTECVDYSTMGKQNCEFGKSLLPFAIWLAERILCQEELASCSEVSRLFCLCH